MLRFGRVIPVWGLLLFCSAAAVRAQTTPPAIVEEPVIAPKVDPIVETVLESNPRTPPELLQAVITLLDLGAPKDAQVLFERLVKSKPNEAVLADLVRKFGSAEMLRLGAQADLGAEGKAFVEAAMTAADKRSRDPQRIAQLIQQLQNPEPALRRAAIVDLREAKTDGVTALLAALAADGRAAEHPQIKAALFEMGSAAAAPLLGALQSPNPRLQRDVIELLGAMQVSSATLYLIGPALLAEDAGVRSAAQASLRALTGAAPTADDAKKVLYRQVKKYFDRVRPFDPDHEGMVEVWSWDAAAGRSVVKKFPADEVGMLLAARLTPALAALDPEQSEFRLLNDTAQLEAAKIEAGYERPLAKDAAIRAALEKSRSVAELEQTLRFALQHGFYGAAAAACEMLGDVATPEILIRPDGGPSPLMEAVEQGDRRLRFAALRAILQLKPEQPYAGSSRVAETLGYFASTGGARRAVVGHPRAAAGQDLVALLGGAGYKADVAYHGRQVLTEAMRSADIDLVLLHSGIDRPDLRETIYQLRRDPRTSRVPIGIVATLDNLQSLRDAFAADPLIVVFLAPQDAAATAFYLDELDLARGRSGISPEERRAQAAQALAWLGELAASPTSFSFYDLRRLTPQVRAALNAPALSTPAAAVLAQMGTADSQRALVEMASQSLAKLGDRGAALKAFEQSVAQHGILLTTPEIIRQYDLYNASEAADPTTQKLRAGILDVLESKKPKPPEKPGERPA